MKICPREAEVALSRRGFRGVILALASPVTRAKVLKAQQGQCRKGDQRCITCNIADESHHHIHYTLVHICTVCVTV